MKLGLLGYPINHSLSPMLYEKFLGDKLTSYEKFSYEKAIDVPGLNFFQTRVVGLNITSPYKTHFLNDVIIQSEQVRELGGINTIAFTDDGNFGTNTDFLAVQRIVQNLIGQYKKINIILLGDGVMAKVTKVVARDFGVSLVQYSRKATPEFYNLDFKNHKSDGQTVIVNSCARDFIFSFPIKGDEIFWDYNYAFTPHEAALPALFKTYINGQELLELQAKEAIKFWKERNPKLNL